ncbi:amino acid ABC transporter permease/ATP-binding protein [Mycobacterium sp. AZCC_0083]|uniref:amino acid ABC transporter permease/ATP-binding protein n=1 Tax=Mycobacterium sp. AZCC_0083 TaxID=2735882 RepID=UPI00161BAED6|nr:amino acid ABC transporter permease/ATP-binding protein [Mycobacterium sp. AZCC_0083]MBB5164185.1 polar amino acid transport system permease protein [Mycobacterium sp. AZCC_0083]
MDKFAHYLTTGWLLEGIVFTLQLTLYGFAGGLLLGLLLAAAQLTRFRPLTFVARAYVVIYRGTPLILQMVFVFTALPHVGISLPPLMAASVALAMNEAAFFAEIFRSGVRAVDPGQLAAARALGLAPRVVAMKVVLPQVARMSVPALGNEAIATMKNSALASIIAVPELTLRTQQLTSATFDYFSIYFSTAVMYLALTGVLTLVQLLVEDALNLDRTTRRSVLSRLVPLQREAPSAPLIASVRPSPPPGPRTIGAPLIRLAGIRKSYGAHTIFDGVDLEIRAGEVVALLGRSGSGKSTLLRMVNGLEDSDAGAITVAGMVVGRDDRGRRLTERQAAEQRRLLGIGMVFQHFNLFSHLSARANVSGPLCWTGTPKVDADGTADSLLAQVGMAERADALPRRLSGGQQQRVGIARALAMNPRVLLLDEPTSALDPELVAEVLDVIRGLAHHEGLTMIIATHQLGFAKEVADRVVFMADGHVVEEGPAAEVIEAPSHEITSRFMNAMRAAEV